MTAIAAVDCPNCEVSDAAIPYFIRRPDGSYLTTVLECTVCGYLQLV